MSCYKCVWAVVRPRITKKARSLPTKYAIRVRAFSFSTKRRAPESNYSRTYLFWVLFSHEIPVLGPHHKWLNFKYSTLIRTLLGKERTLDSLLEYFRTQFPELSKTTLIFHEPNNPLSPLTGTFWDLRNVGCNIMIHLTKFQVGIHFLGDIFGYDIQVGVHFVRELLETRNM